LPFRSIESVKLAPSLICEKAGTDKNESAFIGLTGFVLQLLPINRINKYRLKLKVEHLAIPEKKQIKA
jgi:hypothetical protein